jgi:hypothetical protein
MAVAKGIVLMVMEDIIRDGSFSRQMKNGSLSQTSKV